MDVQIKQWKGVYLHWYKWLAESLLHGNYDREKHT